MTRSLTVSFPRSPSMPYQSPKLLIPREKASNCKVYPLAPTEQKKLNQFLNGNLEISCVMVCARSHSFWRTIKGWLWQSLRWWPPHHCSVPPLPPATLVGLVSDLHWNSSLLQYHQQTCILIIAITNQHHVLSTTAQQEPHHTPHTFHVSGQSYHACTSSRGHGFRSPQGLARIWVSILWHPSEYKSFCYMFHSTTICSPNYLLICSCLYLYKYSSYCMYFASSNINLATYFS